jgi:hypothetical protein
MTSPDWVPTGEKGVSWGASTADHDCQALVQIVWSAVLP